MFYKVKKFVQLVITNLSNKLAEMFHPGRLTENALILRAFDKNPENIVVCVKTTTRQTYNLWFQTTSVIMEKFKIASARLVVVALCYTAYYLHEGFIG